MFRQKYRQLHAILSVNGSRPCLQIFIRIFKLTIRFRKKLYEFHVLRSRYHFLNKNCVVHRTKRIIFTTNDSFLIYRPCTYTPYFAADRLQRLKGRCKKFITHLVFRGNLNSPRNLKSSFHVH